MIGTSELAKAVEQALDYLRSAEQVAEAEVFASSNASLIARLNYTSPIPCNGVEEPKSAETYGIGIQVALDSPEGTLLGFGSEPSDLSQGGVARALAKARQGAVRDPEFRSFPKPGAARRELVDYHDPALLAISDAQLVGAGWKVLQGGLHAFLASSKLAELAGKENIK